MGIVWIVAWCQFGVQGKVAADLRGVCRPGHANTNEELVVAARKQIAGLQAKAGEPAS